MLICQRKYLPICAPTEIATKLMPTKCTTSMVHNNMIQSKTTQMLLIKLLCTLTSIIICTHVLRFIHMCLWHDYCTPGTFGEFGESLTIHQTIKPCKLYYSSYIIYWFPKCFPEIFIHSLVPNIATARFSYHIITWYYFVCIHNFACCLLSRYCRTQRNQRIMDE